MVTPVTTAYRIVSQQALRRNVTKIDLFSKNENQPAEYVTLINPNNRAKNIHDKNIYWSLY